MLLAIIIGIVSFACGYVLRHLMQDKPIFAEPAEPDTLTELLAIFEFVPITASKTRVISCPNHPATGKINVLDVYVGTTKLSYGLSECHCGYHALPQIKSDTVDLTLSTKDKTQIKAFLDRKGLKQIRDSVFDQLLNAGD